MFGSRYPLGWQLIQKLKMSSDLDEIPIIACTAATNFVREQDGYLRSKGIQVVFKPFDVDNLLEAVGNLLQEQLHTSESTAEETQSEERKE